MKKNLILLASLFLAFNSFGAENLNIDKIIVSDNGTFAEGETYKKISSLKVLNLNIPLPFEYVNFLASPDNCEINYITLKPKEKNREFKNLKDEIKRLEWKIESLKTQLNILENLRMNKIPSSSELQSVGSSTEIIFSRIDKLRKDLKDKKMLINRINPIDVAVYCDKPTPVKIKANIKLQHDALRVKPYYVIVARPNNKKLSINMRLVLASDNIKLDKFRLYYYQSVKRNRPIFYRMTKSMPRDKVMAESMPQRIERDTEMKSSRVVFKTGKNLSIEPKETKDILIFKKVFNNLKFGIFIKGYSDTTPYLFTKVKSDTEIYPIDNAKFYVDDLLIKTSYFKGLRKGKEEKLLLGEDTLVVVKKEVVKNLVKEGFFIGKKKKVIFKYTIINNHPYTMDFTLEDRIPPYRKKGLEVKPIYKNVVLKTYNKATGKVVYTFKVKGNSKKVIYVGYERDLE